MAVRDSNKRVMITLPKEVEDELKAKAEESNRSLSNYIYSKIIKPFLENKED